jgi:AhpD family alkylhydroperoxidase
MLRLQFWRFDNEGIRIIMSLSAHLARSPLERPILDLVYLRVSQLNECVRCVEAHVHDALAHGAEERQVHSLATWRETPFFTERERAALAWTESVTEVSQSAASDEIYREVSSQFSQAELVDLTLAIAHMNALSRLVIAFRSGPPPIPAASEGAAAGRTAY